MASRPLPPQSPFSPAGALRRTRPLGQRGAGRASCATDESDDRQNTVPAIPAVTSIAVHPFRIAISCGQGAIIRQLSGNAGTQGTVPSFPQSGKPEVFAFGNLPISDFLIDGIGGGILHVRKQIAESLPVLQTSIR